MDFVNFLIKSKQNTYANGKASRTASSRKGSKDYEYKEVINGENFCYHDTYFGGQKFMGQEVVYRNEKPVWGMCYYGRPLGEDLSEEVLDRILRPALMKVGEDKTVLPLRGAKEFKQGKYTYTFQSKGRLDDFEGAEQILCDGKIIYECHCFGGEIK